MEHIVMPFKKLSRQLTDHFRQNVFDFADGSIEDVELLGLKGANLCEMYHLGLPVPPGFIISTAAYHEYMENGWEITEYLEETYRAAVEAIESHTHRKFGGSTPHLPQPLLLSVRSSPVIKMPG
jgi:pyruvate, orthophosphate dikinase